MKKIFFLEIFLVAIFLLGCQNNGTEEETYTVWTDISPYSEFEKAFNETLKDGYYIHIEFDNATFSQMAQTLKNEGAEYKHDWTEEELKKYFIGIGFDSNTASKTVAWLVTVNHGFVASRDGPLVYYILK